MCVCFRAQNAFSEIFSGMDDSYLESMFLDSRESTEEQARQTFEERRRLGVLLHSWISKHSGYVQSPIASLLELNDTKDQDLDVSAEM